MNSHRSHVWEDSGLESEEEMSPVRGRPPSRIPSHIRDLFACVLPNTRLNLDSEQEVTRFVADSRTSRQQQELVDRVVGFLQIQTMLKVSTVFTMGELQLVADAIAEALQDLRQSEREKILTLARHQRKKQILAELVDSSVLDPSSHLFGALIRHQAAESHK